MFGAFATTLPGRRGYNGPYNFFQLPCVSQLFLNEHLHYRGKCH